MTIAFKYSYFLQGSMGAKLFTHNGLNSLVSEIASARGLYLAVSVGFEVYVGANI